MEITVSFSALRRILFVAMAVVVGAGVAVEVLHEYVRLGDYKAIVPLFSLSYEQNIPTWYSSALLFSCSAALALIAAGSRREGAPFVRHWWGLAAAFFYISLDETACIHENAGRFMKLHGVFYFSWVIPAGVIVAAIGLAYIRFLAHLPKRPRIQFIVSGVIYVGGALFMELPLGYWTEREGSRNFGYAAIDAVEEGMEILGATLFLLALIEYIHTRGYRPVFSAPQGAPKPPASD